MDLECEICHRTFRKLSHYNDHQKIHRYLPGISFKCLADTCYRQFAKYTNFYMHIYRNHHETIQKLHINCTVTECSSTIFSKQNLSSHIAKHIRNGIPVKCPLCINSGLKYANVSSWRSHIHRKHYRLFVQNNNNLIYSKDSAHDVFLSQSTEDLSNREDDANEVIVLDNNNRYVENSNLKSLAALYLTLQAKFFMTEKGLDTIIRSIIDINNESNIQISHHLQQNYNIRLSLDVLNQLNLFNKAHENNVGLLRSCHTRKHFYKENFHYVSPKCIELGVKDNKVRNFAYIPILEILKTMLQNNNIYNEWLTSSSNVEDQNNILSNITDGSVFKSNLFFKNNPLDLRILMYQDIFEICNPLGSSRKKHKILGVYMILGNLETHNWMKTDNIILVALAYHKDIKLFGLSRMFKVIVNDLKELESSGIVINNKVIRGSLLAMLGDNLGSHEIGGFIENFSSGKYICRYCYSSNITQMERSVARNVESYEDDVQIKVLSNETHYRGVKQDSVLNALQHYHVCNPGLPPCIAHDLYEGVVQYDMMLLIKKLMSSTNISIDTINQRLQSKAQQLTLGNMPPLDKKSDKLPGNANENMLILQIFPFAVHDLIDNYQNPFWQMILTLRELSNIVLAFKLSIAQVAVLKDLVLEYIRMRIALFPDNSLRPKHHFLMHYPKLIIQFGPLRLLWTLRYESKHKYFKNIVKHSPNFKNIVHTFSEKHQLLQAVCLSKPDYFSDKIIADNVSAYNENDFSKQINDLVNKKCSPQYPTFISKHVVYRGVTYKENMYICYKKCKETGNFLVSKISLIIVNHDYTHLSFIGDSSEICYGIDTGLYYEVKGSNALIWTDYCKLLSHETLYAPNNATSGPLYYFKSAPIDFISPDE